MRDPLTDDGNVQVSQQWAINGGPPLASSGGPQLARLPFHRWADAGCT